MSQNEYLDEVSLQNPVYTASLGNQAPYYASSSKTESGVAGYSKGMYICICLIVVGLVFAIIAAVSLGLTNHNERTINSFIVQWHATEEERSAHAELPSRMISISAQQRGITLCAIQTYHSENSVYKPLTSETIEQLRTGQMKDHSFYHLSVRLYLSITRDPESKPELTFMYNMTSTLIPFSTIRLEELEFDTQKNAIGPMRSIVLCSDSDEINAAQRCDDKALVTKRKLFVFHGQDTVPLSIVTQAEPLKTQATVELEAVEPLISLRMYNIVFYAKDARILTIEPLQC